MLNRVILMGRLTRDPETRYTQGSEPVAVASFGLAVDRDYKKKDGQKETDFFDITAWRQKAEFVSTYFKKGQLVCIEGRLQREDYTDKNEVKRVGYKIVADNCYFAESKKQENTTQNAEPQNGYSGSLPDDFDPYGGSHELEEDDLPF